MEQVPHAAGMCHWYPHLGCNPLQECMSYETVAKIQLFLIIRLKSLSKKKKIKMVQVTGRRNDASELSEKRTQDTTQQDL